MYLVFELLLLLIFNVVFDCCLNVNRSDFFNKFVAYLAFIYREITVGDNRENEKKKKQQITKWRNKIQV